MLAGLPSSICAAAIIVLQSNLGRKSGTHIV